MKSSRHDCGRVCTTAVLLKRGWSLDGESLITISTTRSGQNEPVRKLHIVLWRYIMAPFFNPQVGLKGVFQMNAKRQMSSASGIQVWFFVILAVASVLLPSIVAAQSLTGALIGTVKDEQGAVIAGAQVRATSPALIGGPATMITDETGQLRFPLLAPGSYALDIEVPGFAAYHEPDIRIGAGATLERTVVLK